MSTKVDKRWKWERRGKIKKKEKKKKKEMHWIIEWKKEKLKKGKKARKKERKKKERKEGKTKMNCHKSQNKESWRAGITDDIPFVFFKASRMGYMLGTARKKKRKKKKKERKKKKNKGKEKRVCLIQYLYQ